MNRPWVPSQRRLSTVAAGGDWKHRQSFRGLEGVYAPDGVTMISQGLYAITDTDTGRAIVAREARRAGLRPMAR